MRQIIATKLYSPPIHSNLLFRPDLMHKLETGLGMGRRLTLVSAPTGYGKTTLVASWLNDKSRRSTWLSLDSEDNNPSRFLYYLVSALEQVCKFISPLTKTLLEDSHYAPSRAIVTAISNDIGADLVYAQQIAGYGMKHDILIAISTCVDRNICFWQN